MPGPGCDFRSGQGGPEWRRILSTWVLCAQALLSISHPLLQRLPSILGARRELRFPQGQHCPLCTRGQTQKPIPEPDPRPGFYRAVTTALLPALRALILPLPSSSLNYSWVSAVVQTCSQSQDSETLGEAVTPFPAANPPGPGSSHCNELWKYLSTRSPAPGGEEPAQEQL